MPQVNKEILFNRFKAGDNIAAESVFRLFHKQFVYYAYQLINDRDAAEDIFIEVFSKLFNRKENFESIENAKSFVVIAVRNACYDYLRKEKRDEALKRELVYLQKEGSTVHLDTDRMEAEIIQRIYTELESLQPLVRKVFILRVFEGLDTSETATTLGISEKTVRNLKASAVSHLRTSPLKNALMLLIFLLRIIPF